MNFFSRSILFAIIIALFSSSVSANNESTNIIQMQDPNTCSAFVTFKDINPSIIKAISINEYGLPVSYRKINSDSELTVFINKCESNIKVKAITTGGLLIEKELLLSNFSTAYPSNNGEVSSKGAKLKTLRELVILTAKALRSDSTFYKVINAANDYAPDIVIKSLTKHRYGIADKLDSISKYTDINTRLIKDQIANYLRSVGVTGWIADTVGYAISGVVWLGDKFFL